MVVARASGMDLASILKRNTFLTLGVRPAGGPGSARDGGTEGGPGRGERGGPGTGGQRRVPRHQLWPCGFGVVDALRHQGPPTDKTGWIAPGHRNPPVLVSSVLVSI